MPLTLLLDLDDTLLDTNLEVFVPAYYGALAKFLADFAAPEITLSALSSGVLRMMENRDPSRTLQDVFEAEFYPKLAGKTDALWARIVGFYRDVFPTLGGATRRRPGGRELIDWAQAAGHGVALATDPLFPVAATEERVRWAGLDPAKFDLISSFETFHFSKSHAAYFAEVLGRLGWPDRAVLMAGNDVERDLRPASELGLTTFHVIRDGDGAGERSGDLQQLQRWIIANEQDIQVPALDTRQAVLAVLEATPAVLQGLTARLTSAEWTREPAPDDWAMIELACHLRDTEREVHALQIETLLASDEPFVARPDAAYWAKQRRYLSEDGTQVVQEFAAARIACLDRLRTVPDQVWAKPARHAIFGPTSFLEVIRFMAEHDRLHVQQAWRTLETSADPAHRN